MDQLYVSKDDVYIYIYSHNTVVYVLFDEY